MRPRCYSNKIKAVAQRGEAYQTLRFALLCTGVAVQPAVLSPAGEGSASDPPSFPRQPARAPFGGGVCVETPPAGLGVVGVRKVCENTQLPKIKKASIYLRVSGSQVCVWSSQPVRTGGAWRGVTWWRLHNSLAVSSRLSCWFTASWPVSHVLSSGHGNAFCNCDFMLLTDCVSCAV